MADRYPTGDLAALSLVEALRLLGDPVRFEIVRQLADGEMHAKTASEWNLGLQKSALSHHFRALRLAGFTEVVERGREHGMRLRIAEIDARFPGLIALLART